ncbi:SIMPL domain-containing protein [Nonomuraea longicatena]|uniref:SIMPL domain-containing protein n=1 Tax=Nonomuraea longicatena TaxID=83682 RepID=A0ABP4A8Y0_9ACTN
MDTANQRITVVGVGAVSAVPDMMRLTAGVEVREPAAGAVATATRAAAARLSRALTDAGVAARDLRTTELSLGPEYTTYPEVSGYRAAQGVEAVVRDLAGADQVIDAVAAVGEESRLNGIAFEVSDPAAALVEARRLAFEDARARAAQYAELAGRPLGRVLSIAEEPARGAHPVPMAAAERSSLSPGEQTVAVEVRVEYAFA